MADALIRLEHLWREFPSGEGTIAALKDVSLDIRAGEMVAIIGASGSGKSTLMNILGCLDRPTRGNYRISGRETRDLDADELAQLRREHFGFIFQRYHLLAELTADENVEIPAIYAGLSPSERTARADALLERLGMADRTRHKPGQLSGGQQQRVSIARALINGAEVILADEPTGALDTHSSEEVLNILDELHADGKTIIIVTHDESVAARAERIIQISDGEIFSDRATRAPVRTQRVEIAAPPPEPTGIKAVSAKVDRLREAFRMARRAMFAHKLRTLLTMLGIIIGIASVVSVVALGEGSRQKVLSNISGLGTNTLEIFPGKSFGDARSGKIRTLVVADAVALSRQSFVAAVTPTVTSSGEVQFGSTVANAQVNGVGEEYFDAKGITLQEGELFDARNVRYMTQDVIIDENARKGLFGDATDGVIGKTILVDAIPARVIGVVSNRQGGFGSSNNLTLYLPYTTVQTRIVGDTALRSIILKVTDDTPTSAAESAVTTVLTQRHGSQDFFIMNTDDIRQAITSTTETMTLLIAAIAVISLVVGGIGVMNIMLVSVSERINEIGVRMAVGARRADILQQFLIEAIMVCMIGGVLGIATALGFGLVFPAFGSNFTLIYSYSSIVYAVACSTLIGVIFGFLPARSASRLDPVVALTAMSR